MYTSLCYGSTKTFLEIMNTKFKTLVTSREGEKWYFGGMYLYTCFQGFVYLKQGPKINTAKFSVMTKLVDRHMSGFYVVLKAFLCI